MQPGNFRKRKVLGTLGFPFCFPENLVSPKLTENGAYLRAGKRLNADVGWLEKSAAPARARSARGASLLGTWAGRVHTPRRARALAALARAGGARPRWRRSPALAALARHRAVAAIAVLTAPAMWSFKHCPARHNQASETRGAPVLATCPRCASVATYAPALGAPKSNLELIVASLSRGGADCRRPRSPLCPCDFR